MVFLFNELMSSHCKGLDEDATSISSLDSVLHILTPDQISSIAASIIFNLITLLYYNMSYFIDFMIDDI